MNETGCSSELYNFKPSRREDVNVPRLNLWDAMRMYIEASKPIPRYEPGYDSNGKMIEVSLVPAMIGISAPERILTTAGVTGADLSNAMEALHKMPFGNMNDNARSLANLMNRRKVAEDAYDIAERIIAGKATKEDKTKLQQLKIYQRVRTRYNG